MPNSLAYVVLFCWPLLMVCIFAVMPRAQAIAVSIIGGYLLLPSRAGFDLPVLPTVDKTLLPALVAAILCLIMPDRAARTRTWGSVDHEARTSGAESGSNGGGRAAVFSRRAGEISRPGVAGASPEQTVHVNQPVRTILLVLFFATLAAPFFTTLTNTEPLGFGPRFLPALSLYDAFSMTLGIGIYLLPFVVGWRYLAGPQEQRALVVVLIAGGLLYSVPALFEVRMSPQLNTWIYGFFPHSFGQHMREGGYRPIVFLGHGLALSIFLTMTVLAALAMWRSFGRERGGGTFWLLSAAWLFMTLVLSKSLGALVIAIVFGLVVAFARKRSIIVFAAVLAVGVTVYPVLRGSGLSPVEQVYEMVNSFNAERAESFKFRLDNENALLDRANLKPLFGWGSWGRNRIFDPVTGDDESVTDGDWIITIGVHGWFGYLSRYGLLAVPLIALARRRKAPQLSFAATGLCMVQAANLLDAIPNATIVPVTWLVAGSLAGLACREVVAIPETGPVPAAAEPASPPETARPVIRYTRTRG